MFKKFAIFATLFFAATLSQATIIKQGTIQIQRDMTDNPHKQDIQNFGCVVLRRADGNGGPPYPAVSGSASGSDCAQFQIIYEGDDDNVEDRQYRFTNI